MASSTIEHAMATLHPFDPSIAPDMRATILDQLTELEDREQVRILFAIESGSRAWGFPSPDSDYDARFVYVRPLDWYLTITPGRDVIELPIEDELDINGWDLKKALGLLLKPNPVLLEWLSSPIRYIWRDEACQKLIDLARKVGAGVGCVYHYYNLGENLYRRHVKGEDEVKIKRYFYIVRPAMALRWLRMHPGKIPPMNFQELAAGVDLPDALVAELDELLKRKRVTRELGYAARIPSIDRFIEDEFSLAKKFTETERKPRHDLMGEANALFRELVKGDEA